MPQNHFRDRDLGRTAHERGAHPYARWARAALCVALTTIVVCAGAAAARAGDDDDGESFASKFMRTLGLKDPTAMEYGINYSERSPLVVPPTRDLPPPAAAAAPSTPAWPKDPDIQKRAQAKAKAKSASFVDWASELDRPLRPDELNKLNGRPAPVSRSSQSASEPGQGSDPAAAKKNPFSFDWLKSEDYGTFTGEPARTTLTDPPPGYQTPSPDQPYGISPERKQSKIPTLADRMEPSR